MNVPTQGLAVTLRPYQRQSLKFMLDKEGAEGGFRDLLFCPVSNNQGATYWYSPVLGRLCADVAPMPQGGILGHSLCSVSAVLCVVCSDSVCMCSISYVSAMNFVCLQHLDIYLQCFGVGL